MKIVITMNAYHDLLTSIEVTQPIHRVVQRLFPKATILSIPLSNGNLGTSHNFSFLLEGLKKEAMTVDPFMNPIKGHFYYSESNETAMIDMAEASGLQHIKVLNRNPLLTSSYGTGVLIDEALNLGSKEIILSTGGTASHDMGLGILHALGGEFYNQDGKIIDHIYGGSLSKIKKIELGHLNPKFRETTFKLISPSRRTLFEKDGVINQEAKDQGASQKILTQLEKSFQSIILPLEKIFKKEVKDHPLSGAGGGAGALFLLFGNEILDHTDAIFQILPLRSMIQDSDLIVTGDGCLSRKTLAKSPILKISTVGQENQIPIVAINETLGDDYEISKRYGIQSCFSVFDKRLPDTLSKPERQDRTIKGIYRTSYEIFSLIKSFTKSNFDA